MEMEIPKLVKVKDISGIRNVQTEIYSQSFDQQSVDYDRESGIFSDTLYSPSEGGSQFTHFDSESEDIYESISVPIDKSEQPIVKSQTEITEVQDISVEHLTLQKQNLIREIEEITCMLDQSYDQLADKNILIVQLENDKERLEKELSNEKTNVLQVTQQLQDYISNMEASIPQMVQVVADSLENFRNEILENEIKPESQPSWQSKFYEIAHLLNDREQSEAYNSPSTLQHRIKFIEKYHADLMSTKTHKKIVWDLVTQHKSKRTKTQKYISHMQREFSEEIGVRQNQFNHLLNQFNTQKAELIAKDKMLQQLQYEFGNLEQELENRKIINGNVQCSQQNEKEIYNLSMALKEATESINTLENTKNIQQIKIVELENMIANTNLKKCDCKLGTQITFLQDGLLKMKSDKKSGENLIKTLKHELACLESSNFSYQKQVEELTSELKQNVISQTNSVRKKGTSKSKNDINKATYLNDDMPDSMANYIDYLCFS